MIVLICVYYFAVFCYLGRVTLQAVRRRRDTLQGKEGNPPGYELRIDALMEALCHIEQYAHDAHELEWLITVFSMLIEGI
jgi:hypothetical protein